MTTSLRFGRRMILDLDGHGFTLTMVKEWGRLKKMFQRYAHLFFGESQARAHCYPADHYFINHVKDTLAIEIA